MVCSYIRRLIYPYKIALSYINNNSKILDIGCGNGNILNDIKELNFLLYTGIDPKIKNNYKNKNVSLLNDKIENYINHISKYDCILMIDVMHHINKNNQEKLITNILQNMKVNSILIYKDISNRNFFYALMNWFHDFIFNFQIIHYLDSKKILEISNNINNTFIINHFYKRILWYDHEFLIIRK